MSVLEQDLQRYGAGRHATIRNAAIYYELYNEQLLAKKPAIILIHGFLSSVFSFRKLIPLFSTHYPIVALDLPPFGKSEKSRNFTYSYQNFAGVVIDIAKQLGIKKAYLIGHSMGGQIALQVAKQNPELVEKLILLCSSGYLRRAKQLLIASSYLPFFSYYVKYWFKKKGAKESLLNVVYDHTMIDEEMIEGYLSPFYEKDVFRALTRMIRHREGDLLSEELQSINVPCLLIWGKEDRVVPITIGERLSKDLHHSHLIIYEKTGHLLPEEKPEEVCRDILSFLNNN